MGEIFIRDDEWDRQIRTDGQSGLIEIDLTTDRPELVVPEDVSVQTRDRSGD